MLIDSSTHQLIELFHYIGHETEILEPKANNKLWNIKYSELNYENV